ncbi:MAG: hypothetical protein K9N55_05325 [Phycisphaerae bacterium]|nr:hypothetical protein [Phycisphaerae bacterium]
MLENEKLIDAVKNLVRELEEGDSGSGFRTCDTCQFGPENSLPVFDVHCQFGYAYDALSNVLGQLEELTNQSQAS